MNNSRIESLLSRLTKPARGAGWVLGVFDLEGDLLDFAITNGQNDRRRALDMLGAVPVPLSAGSVMLKVTGDDGKIASTLCASTMLDAARYVALVLVRPLTNDAAWLKISQNLKSVASRIAAAIASESIPTLEGRRASTSSSEECAFYLLTQELQVAFASQPQNASSSDFAKLVAPREGRLPALFERAVRRLTKCWDFSRVDSCATKMAFPLPGVALSVAPMSGTGVMVGVFIKLEAHRHPAAAAAAAYRLSPREREVLYALLDGRSVSGIAAMLELAESTVSDHIARMIVKTNAHNRIEMAALLLGWPAMRPQLVSADAPANGSLTDSLADPQRTNGEPSRRVSWRYKIRSVH
ncbi:MAG: helix-turn-helix transcriptional regulator [Candidatus Cybelea sp.]